MFTHTIVYPGAVMVVLLNTTITDVAVVATFRAFSAALVTHFLGIVGVYLLMGHLGLREGKTHVQ